jgi:hypothetical protein
MIDVPDLVYTIRCDGGPGPIPTTQIGGRSGRVLEGKEKGVLIDFTDEYGKRMEGRKWQRIKTYKANKWTIVEWKPN